MSEILINLKKQILDHDIRLKKLQLEKTKLETQLFEFEKIYTTEIMINKLMTYNLVPNKEGDNRHRVDIITYLRLFNGYIAGSSALFSYINSDEKEGDLDIWFQVSIDPNDKSLPYSKDVRNVLSTFLQSLGYTIKQYSEYSQNGTKKEYLENTRFNNLIEKIYEYSMGSKKIQIILTKVPKMEILKSFDLSFCAVSWDGSKYEALEPELTLRKVGYSLNPPVNGKELVRLEKYATKGFKIYESEDLR